MNTTEEFKKARVGTVAMKGKMLAVKTWAKNNKTKWELFNSKRYVGTCSSFYLRTNEYSIVSVPTEGV